jgi:hypothetical protein
MRVCVYRDSDGRNRRPAVMRLSRLTFPTSGIYERVSGKRRKKIRYAHRMNVSPGEGPGHDREGRATGPTRNNLLARAGCVSPPSQPSAKVVTDKASRLVSEWSSEACEAVLMPIQQPPGGSEVLTCPSAVGPARGPNDRQEGGPTGTTALPSGSGGGCGGRGGRAGWLG